MEESPGQPVKIFPRDEMFPKYNFLKRRLHSIFPRFKSIIEKGELAELIPDGKKRFDEISTAREKLKDSISLYVTGSHSTVSPQMMEKYFFVSMKGMADYGLVSKSLQDQEFRESIRNIAEQPSVIVHVAEAGDGNTKETVHTVLFRVTSLTENEVNIKGYRLKQPKILLHFNSQKIVNETERDRNSCVLCSASYEEYSSLQDFNINDVLSDLESMKLMIQSCLQVKVVRVLQLMVDVIDEIVLDNPVEESDQCARETTGLGPLLISVKQTLKNSVSEPAFRKVLEQGSDDVVKYISSNLESRICQLLSASSRVKQDLFQQLMYKSELDKTIKEKVEKWLLLCYPMIGPEAAIVCEELAQSLSEDLRGFAANIEEKIGTNAEDLRQICFEICGVFRQAKLPLSSLSGAVRARMMMPKLPRILQNSILSLDGVHGCGTIYGRLVVHIKEGTPENMIDMDEIRDKIKTTVGNSMWLNNLEIKQVRSCSTTGVTYDSGKFLRVKLIQNETQDGNVITNNNNSYNYGTLGCFIKGKGQGDGSEFATKMYALSCAHVFSPDCEKSVEIGRTDQNFDHFGTVSKLLTCRREDMVDIAAILVDADVVDRCNLRLKNVQGYEGRNSILHEGTVDHFIGAEVYKWGSVSGLTEGLIISYDYRAQGVETLNDDFNILIKCLPTSGTKFSQRGDSGTLVCLEDPEGEKIVALSMINGALEDATPDRKYICSYSCHLHTSIEELSKAANMSFEWCME